MKVSAYRKSRLVSLCLALLMIFGALPANAAGGSMPDRGASSPQNDVQALSRLVASTWSDGFFSAMALTVDKTEYVIDGEEADSAVAPAIVDGEVLLPRAAIAEVRDLITGLSAQRAAPLIRQSEAEALGLDVEVLPDDGAIIITAPYQTRRLLVKTTRGALADTFGAETVLPLPGNRFALQYATEVAAREACLRLEGDPAVVYAEPDGVIYASATLEAQADEPPVGWGTTRIGARAFWPELPANAPAVTVAVLDTGIDDAHPFFAGRIAGARWNFIAGNGSPADDNGHGTHVSGIVKDATPANVMIMPLKVLNTEGKGADSLALEAVRYAVDHGAKVINMSLGGTENASHGWTEAIEYASGRGAVLVAAAGNEGRQADTYPAALPGVIAVAASTSADAIDTYSNYGAFIDIGAPGSNIVSAYPGGKFIPLSGTSMAAPHVSAAAALLFSYDASIKPQQVLPYLQATSRPWSGTRRNGLRGAGIVNITPRSFQALQPQEITLEEGGGAAVINAYSCPPDFSRTVTFTSNAPAIAAVSPGGGVQGLLPGRATVTLAGPGVSATVPITVKSIDRIEVVSSTVGQEMAQPLRASATIDVYFTDGSVRRGVTLDEKAMTGYVQGKQGTQTITVHYRGRSAQFPIWADTRRLLRLEVGEPDMSRCYYPWEPLDLSGGKVNITYEGLPTQATPLTLDMCSPYDKYYPGQRQYIDVRWNGILAGSFSIYYSWTYYYTTHSSLAKAPDRTFYPPLIPLSTKGGTASVSYYEMENFTNVIEEFDLKDCILNTEGWFYTSGIGMWGGVKGIFLPSTQAFGSSGASLLAYRTPDPKKPISMAALPDKLIYKQGEPIDPAGGVVRFRDWSDKIEDYDLQDMWCSWGTSGTGEQTIQVTVRNYPAGDSAADSRKWELTTSFKVQVQPVALQGITLLSAPGKTVYTEGEALNTAGGKVRASFSDGRTMELDLQPELCMGYNAWRLGTQTITVNLSGKTASFPVTLNRKSLPNGITVLTLPETLFYPFGGQIDLTGGTVAIRYDDGSSEALSMTDPRLSLSFPNGNSGGFRTVRVSLGTQYSADFPIVIGRGEALGIPQTKSLQYKTEAFRFPGGDNPYVRWEVSGNAITVDNRGNVQYTGRGSATVTTVLVTDAGRIVLGQTEVNVNYTLWQWLALIFFFGWAWM